MEMSTGLKVVLTLVYTMCGLCARAAFTVWKMSIPPSNLTLSISDMQVMNTPLRDMPSLEEGRIRKGELCMVAGFVIYYCHKVKEAQQ